jgi:hypothetical protein
MLRMFSFNCLPGLKRGIFTAGRVMRSLVAGLMPEREGLFETQYEPKPVIDTLFPSLSSFSMILVTAESTRVMSFLLNAVSSLTFVISSLLFMVAFPGIQMVESNASGLEMYCDNNSLSRETGICALAHYIFISALWTMRKNERNSYTAIVMLIETCYGFVC